jgi:hypothetical protein
MTAQTSPDLSQLTETVARLSEALAASERRHAAVARTVRWTSLTLVTLIGTAIYAGSDRIKAYAAQMMPSWDGHAQQMAQQPPTLDKILMSLMGSEGMEGALVKMLQSATMIGSAETMSHVRCMDERSRLPEAERDKVLCYSKTPVEDLGEYYLDASGKLPEPPDAGASQQQQMAYAQKMTAGTIMAAGQTLANAAVLLHRVRRDSDLLRRTVNDIGGVEQTLNGIKDELARMNVALRAVPVMAGEMGVMNQQMSVMSYSVGSTMGRMGNILPW